MVRPADYPPTNIEIDAVGLFLFTPSDVDVYIFSFLNQTKKETECAIVPAGVFLNYKPHREEDGEIKLKLFLSSFGLVEFRDYDGGEFYFMGIFDKSRSYTKYYRNWSFFE